jgi:hypothetical protein
MSLRSLSHFPKGFHTKIIIYNNKAQIVRNVIRSPILKIIETGKSRYLRFRYRLFGRLMFYDCNSDYSGTG